MSWATRVAAETTSHPPLAARLVGESFELAIKVLNILVRGPGEKLKYGHSLTETLRDVPALEQLLRRLWGSDLEYVLSIVDEECHPPQVRYGASAGRPSREARILPSGYAETADVWTTTTLTLYEELMSSLGRAVWSNYPEGDRNGNAVNRKITLNLSVRSPHGSREMSADEEAALEEKAALDPTVWGSILKAEGNGIDIPYWGIIPFERLQDSEGTQFFVRARVSGRMVIDVEVTKHATGFDVGGFRVSGQENAELKVALYTAVAVMPHRGEVTRG